MGTTATVGVAFACWWVGGGCVVVPEGCSLITDVLAPSSLWRLFGGLDLDLSVLSDDPRLRAVSLVTVAFGRVLCSLDLFSA